MQDARRPRGRARGPAWASRTRTVSFESTDGLTLHGWYIPSRNGKAIIAFPGRNGPQDQARMLARHGYGVLLFDRRGEGRCEGQPNMLGLGRRVATSEGAIAFLERRGSTGSAGSACRSAAS